jgi:chemotaxis response regulator CheB
MAVLVDHPNIAKAAGTSAGAPRFPIVATGASAGGLEASTGFLSALGNSSSAA